VPGLFDYYFYVRVLKLRAFPKDTPLYFLGRAKKIFFSELYSLTLSSILTVNG